MLKTFFSTLTLLFITIAPTLSLAQIGKSSPQTNSKTPRTVVDFYNLLPNKYVNNMSIAARQKYLKKQGTSDLTNGYLEIFGQMDGEDNIYLAVFKKDAGGYLVTLAAGSYSLGKISTYRFLEYNNQKWTDVSKKVLPADFNMTNFYDAETNNFYPCELPRYNRTINCRDKDSKLTYLGWTGSNFVIE